MIRARREAASDKVVARIRCRMARDPVMKPPGPFAPVLPRRVGQSRRPLGPGRRGACPARGPLATSRLDHGSTRALGRGGSPHRPDLGAGYTRTDPRAFGRESFADPGR